MKRIEATIRPERLDAVKEALTAAGIAGITIIDVKGHGAQLGIQQHWRGETYTIDLLPKVMIIVVVGDEKVEPVIDVILKSARTGRIGDGKIFVTPVDDAIRIRTGERGTSAV